MKNPLKDIKSGAKKVDHVQLKKGNLNQDNRPEQKEEIHKLSEPNIFTATKGTTEQKILIAPICITDEQKYM